MAVDEAKGEYASALDRVREELRSTIATFKRERAPGQSSVVALGYCSSETAIPQGCDRYHD
jgi:hypothetical protein